MSALRFYSSLLGGVVLVVGSAAWYWVRSRRPTPEQREYQRRQRLSNMGRITDGTVVDFREVGEDNSSPMRLLIYSYDVGGVSYECSQDVSALRRPFDVQACQLGLPASVKYDPQNPANSIVVAEDWIGLRQ
jgi:hypothetical protein